MNLFIRISFRTLLCEMTLVKYDRVEIAASTLLIYHETPHKKSHSSHRFAAFCLADWRYPKLLNILKFQRKSVSKRTSGFDRKSPKMELMEGCVNLNLSNCKHHRTLFLKIPFVFCEIPYLQKVIVYNITLSSTCSRLCKNTYIFSLKLVKFDISSHIFMG